MRGNSVVSYCAVPVRTESGAAIGTLCHFDDKPCQSQGREATFLMCIADAFVPWVAGGADCLEARIKSPAPTQLESRNEQGESRRWTGQRVDADV